MIGEDLNFQTVVKKKQNFEEAAKHQLDMSESEQQLKFATIKPKKPV